MCNCAEAKWLRFAKTRIFSTPLSPCQRTAAILPPWQPGVENKQRRRSSDEHWRLCGDAVEISREQSYGILQEALANYARWVNQAHGIDIWLPATLPECALGIPY